MHITIRACFLCFFYNPYMSLFNSKNFSFTCIIIIVVELSQWNSIYSFLFSCYVSPVAGNPTRISLDQISPTTVRVIWSPPSGGATVTSYVVHYRNTTSVRTKSAPTTFIFTFLTGLTSGATYTISVEATSQHLSGESEEMTISLSE